MVVCHATHLSVSLTDSCTGHSLAPDVFRSTNLHRMPPPQNENNEQQDVVEQRKTSKLNVSLSNEEEFNFNREYKLAKDSLNS